MKSIHFAMLGLALVFAFSGCSTLDRNEKSLLQQRGISHDVYQSMLYGDRLSLQDIVELSQKHVPASLIVHYLRSTGAAYRVTRQKVASLRKAGVDQEVVKYLLMTSEFYEPRGYYMPRGYYGSSYAYPYYDPYDYGPYYGSPYYGNPYYGGPFYGSSSFVFFHGDRGFRRDHDHGDHGEHGGRGGHDRHH